MRLWTSRACVSISAARRRASKTKKPPMAAAAMRTAATTYRLVGFCIDDSIKTPGSNFDPYLANMNPSELDERLDKQPILVHATGGGLVVDLFVGGYESHAAIAWKNEPVRATGNDASL